MGEIAHPTAGGGQCPPYGAVAGGGSEREHAARRDGPLKENEASEAATPSQHPLALILAIILAAVAAFRTYARGWVSS